MGSASLCYSISKIHGLSQLDHDVWSCDGVGAGLHHRSSTRFSTQKSIYCFEVNPDKPENVVYHLPTTVGWRNLDTVQPGGKALLPKKRCLLYDDANLPNLLSLPYMLDYGGGGGLYDPHIYKRTRSFVLGKGDEFYYESKTASVVPRPGIRYRKRTRHKKQEKRRKTPQKIQKKHKKTHRKKKTRARGPPKNPTNTPDKKRRKPRNAPHLAGLGSPHRTVKRGIWYLGWLAQALSSVQPAEILDTLKQIVDSLPSSSAGSSSAGSGSNGGSKGGSKGGKNGNLKSLHEAVSADDVSKFTRKWFDWPNAVFSELLFEMGLVGGRDSLIVSKEPPKDPYGRVETGRFFKYQAVVSDHFQTNKLNNFFTVYAA